MFLLRKRKKKKNNTTITKSNLYGFIWTIRPEMPLYNMILEELNNMHAIPQEHKNIIDNSEPLFMNINLRVYKKEDNKR